MRVGGWRARKLALKHAATAVVLSAACTLAAPFALAKTPHHRHHVYLAPQAGAQPASDDFTYLGPTAPGVSSILIDASTGSVISESGADIPRYPASLTKLMTLDLAFQALRDGRMTLDTPIIVSVHAASVEPVKLGLLPGDTLTVRQAILAMTTMSANDAATALGEYLGGGSEYRCSQMMTLRAHALGMAQTQFYNASGLPDPAQVTTARDLAILARDIIINYPQDQPFFEALSFNFNGRTIYSNNAMLRIYPGAMGMKTGYTILARHNLVTAAERNGRILIGIELHEPSWGSTYAQMTTLLDNGFGGHIDGGNTTLLAARQSSTPPLSAANPPQLAALPPQSPAGSLFPVADAATIRPMHITANLPVTQAPVRGWTAQVGSYSRMKYAREQAITVHEMQGVGIARIARVDHHGKVMWAAQLAGLSLTDAHHTCRTLAQHGDSCLVIAPQNEHLAMRDSSAG